MMFEKDFIAVRRVLVSLVRLGVLNNVLVDIYSVYGVGIGTYGNIFGEDFIVDIEIWGVDKEYWAQSRNLRG